MTEEQRNRLETIARSMTLTREERVFVSEFCEALGIKITNTRCKSCWKDAAIECLLKLREQATNKPHGEPKRYILKNDVDVYFAGIRVNAATLTDELAENILARGFNPNFFEVCK